jgi:phytoene dehydrogenase-like protein
LKADVVVIGGGVNGLTTAALLAKAGRKPLVLERRDVVGGCAVTEEFHPGFKASTVAQLAGPFRASLAGDLGLQVETIQADPVLTAPRPDGRGLTLYADPARTAAELTRLSEKDAAAWPALDQTLRRISPILDRVLRTSPPDLDHPRVGDALPLLGLGLAFRRLGRKDATRVLRWAPMAIADFAAEWFETDLLRAVLAGRAVWGSLAGPWSAGTTTPFLVQTAVGGGGAAGATVFVKGGLGALSRAIAQAAERAGAVVRTGATVRQITVADGRATGVVLEGGETIEAKAVVSGADPQRTCLGLLEPALLDPDDLRRLRNYRAQGMASRVTLALSGLPRFAGLPDGDPARLRGRIHVGASIDDLERAFDEAKYGGISTRPYLDVTIPTLTDPSLAPNGQHVLSAYVQYTPYRLRTGDWGARRDEVKDRVLETLEEHAPGLRGLVVAAQVLTPKDLETTYGVTGGHPLHGEPSLDQLFATRPMLGWARYRTPIEGLYLCGAGTHPGGGVTGGPGQNAAAAILKDLR